MAADHGSRALPVEIQIAAKELRSSSLEILGSARIHRTGQPEIGRVRPFQGLVERFDPVYRQDRTKYFLGPEPGRAGKLVQDRRWNEMPLARGNGGRIHQTPL